MSWRSYFWPCAFFLLLGIFIGLASGVVAYRHRSAIYRLPNRMATSVARLTKPSPPAPVVTKSVEQDSSLTLASFESDTELSLFGDSNVSMERTSKHATSGRSALKVTFPDGGGAIGTWRTLPANWSGYERLRFDVYSIDPNVPFLFI